MLGVHVTDNMLDEIIAEVDADGKNNQTCSIYINYYLLNYYFNTYFC